jgi:hypothetical protein
VDRISVSVERRKFTGLGDPRTRNHFLLARYRHRESEPWPRPGNLLFRVNYAMRKPTVMFVVVSPRLRLHAYAITSDGDPRSKRQRPLGVRWSTCGVGASRFLSLKSCHVLMHGFSLLLPRCCDLCGVRSRGLFHASGATPDP